MPEKLAPSAPATLHDVARLAGVSYQTVSRVVNQSPSVSPETLEKVNQAIEALNYRPNRVARSLVTGKSNALHVLALDFSHLRMLPAMHDLANENGFQLRLTSFRRSNNALHDLDICLRDIAASGPDGLLVVLPWALTTEKDLIALVRNIPFVVVSNRLGYGTNAVLIDQREGTRMAIEHLLSLGHRRFALIDGPQQYYDAQIRSETARKILAEHQAELIVAEQGNFGMTSGYEAAQRLLQRGKSFTALFCANDEMALGAMRALKSAGLRIPQDVSVVGFDDLNFSAYCDPPLTTVRQDFYALGTHALQHLLSLLRAPNTAPHQRLLYPELIVRSSTSAPRAQLARGE
jgi:LacI family transcriptional regulator